MSDGLLRALMREAGLSLGLDYSTTDKLTRVFAHGVSPSYRYFSAGLNGKNQRVHFCWATNRNAAGFFLTWRETTTANGKQTKRDKWAARRKRKASKALALRRCQAFKQPQ